MLQNWPIVFGQFLFRTTIYSSCVIIIPSEPGQGGYFRVWQKWNEHQQAFGLGEGARGEARRVLYNGLRCNGRRNAECGKI